MPVSAHEYVLKKFRIGSILFLHVGFCLFLSGYGISALCKKTTLVFDHK